MPLGSMGGRVVCRGQLRRGVALEDLRELIESRWLRGGSVVVEGLGGPLLRVAG